MIALIAYVVECNSLLAIGVQRNMRVDENFRLVLSLKNVVLLFTLASQPEGLPSFITLNIMYFL